MATNKKTQLYDLILERMIAGRYRFGERILVKELGQETGASRQPIMTALNALSVDGFVSIVPQVGCEVISPTTRDIADFYRMFARLEGLLAELAASRRSAAQLQALRAANAIIRSDLEHNEGRRYQELNRSFHGIFHEMAGSPLLTGRQNAIFAMSDFIIMQVAGFRPHVVEATREHDVIAACIEARDAAGARAAAEGHIVGVADSLRQAAERQAA